MIWVKAQERLPEVLLGESRLFFCREVNNHDNKKVLFYGLGKGSLLLREPSKWEWLDDEKIKYPPYLHDLINAEKLSGTTGTDSNSLTNTPP